MVWAYVILCLSEDNPLRLTMGGGDEKKIGKTKDIKSGGTFMFNKDGITDHFPCLNTRMTCESWVRWQMAGSLSWDLGLHCGAGQKP